MRAWFLATLALVALSACSKEEICAPGELSCGGASCATALYVACFATDQVIGVTADLGTVTAQYRVDDGPISLARATAGLYVGSGVSPVVDLIEPGESDPRRFVLPAAT